ncbi:MAG: ATP-dependent RecD-like DNA helicase [Deltaproteobacteria bacterium]|nr:ATP-dependent RecD-like DNA helicase [Deltaproteobacteria bacterium]
MKPAAGRYGSSTEMTVISGGTDQDLEGTLEKIVYRDDLSGWSVLRLSLSPDGQIIMVTGMFISVQPGERLRIRGRWTESPEYGKQFAMGSYVSLSPETLTGIRQYLASGLIEGIGHEISQRLVDEYGLDILDIIENKPNLLTRVRGIGKVRARKISNAWKRHKEIKDTMIFLQSHGISAGHAMRIFKVYGKNTRSVLQDNPYSLCFDVFGIGFKTADRIAVHLGIDPQSPQRARAGLLYVLETISEKGHVCYPCETLVKETESILSISRVIIQDALEMLRIEEHLVLDEKEGRAFVYLKKLHEAESEAASLLKSFLNADMLSIPMDTDNALSWFESGYHITLAPEQRDAIASAIVKKALIVTGGPGTGKTTLINGMIKIFEKKRARVHLCAPTGRAAKRMSEATGHEAKTIHRLFELFPSGMADEYCRERELKTDILIIDEASMMDTVLFLHVLRGLPSHARLILVGDADQLPSVGPGNVLLDVIRSGLVKTIRLERIFRQSKKSLIVINAHRINKGQIPFEKNSDTLADYFFINREDPGDVLKVVKEMVAFRIPARFGLDPFTDIQVLSPMHRGLLGVSNINTELQRLLNPSNKGLSRGSHRLCKGDKVMQVRNNYDLGVFNGDLGRIVLVDPEKKTLDVDFDDKRIRYEREDLDELMLAYACSIHKSQGNEYPAAVIVMHTQHYIMLQRNLLYTAITRGKSLVIVVGNTKAIAIATGSKTKGRRYTMLTERLM